MLFPPSVSTQRLSPCMVLCSLSHSTFVCILCCFRFPRGQLANKPLSSALHMVRLSQKVTSRYIPTHLFTNPHAHRGDRHFSAALRPAATTSTWKKPNTPGARRCRHSSLLSCCMSTGHSPCCLCLIWSHLVSLLEHAKSAWAAWFGVSPCVTGMSNTAKRLRNSRLCVDLQAHQLLLQQSPTSLDCDWFIWQRSRR